MRDPESEETTPTELASILRDWGVSRIVVTGLATDYCVKATALDGATEGFSVQLMRDAVRSVDLEAGDGDRAIAEVEAAGGVVV